MVELTTKQHIRKQNFVHPSTALSEIVQPLACYGIKYFAYQKKYSDGSMELLSTHPEFTQQYITQEVWQHVLDDAEYDKPSYYLWENLTGSDILLAVSQRFGFANGFLVGKKYRDYSEFYHFATEADTFNMDEFYINHLDTFVAFITYFHLHAKALLPTTKRHKAGNAGLSTEQIPAKKADKKASFCQHAPFVDDIRLSMLCAFHRLTKREHECAYYLKQGLPTKKIAERVFLSTRSIEKHLAELKRKLSAKSIYHLTAKIITYGVAGEI